MAIPGVPSLPVMDLPGTDPGMNSGSAIANLGAASQEMAGAGLQLQAKIRKAQQHVDTIAAQNELNTAFGQMQIDLKKTQNSRDIPDTLEKYQNEVNAIVKKWTDAGSPAAMQIGMAASSLRPEMDQHAQLRQITLMTSELKDQAALQIQEMLPDYVNAYRRGDRQREQAILNNVNGLYTSDLIGDEEKKVLVNGFQLAAQKEVNQAAVMSPNPQEREAAIAQLEKGSSGPLDLTNLSDGDKNALLLHAKSADRELRNLHESQQLNGALNTIAGAFEAPEFKGNFDAQLKALQDGGWLTQHGIVDSTGKPDRVMAEKLSAEVERTRGYAKQQQDDNDNKALDQYEPQIYENKLSRSAIDQIPGISPRARRTLHNIWNQQFHLNRSEDIAARQMRMQEITEKSAETAAGIAADLTSGKAITPFDIRTNSDLTPRDKSNLLGMLKAKEQDPSFQTALQLMYSRFAKPRATDDPDEIGRYYQRNWLMHEELLKDIETKGLKGPDIIKDADEIRKRAVKGDIADSLNKMFGSPVRLSTWDKVRGAIGQTLGISSLEIVKPPADATPKEKRIRVKEKSSGQTGSIPESEFDANLYEKVN